MIYVITKSAHENTKKYIFITLEEKNYPLREIDLIIGRIPNGRIICLADDNGDINIDYLDKMIEIYKDSNSVLAISPADTSMDTKVTSIDAFQYGDSLIFKKEMIRPGLRDISHTSSYYSVVKHIIKLCGGHCLNVPANRPVVDLGNLYPNTIPPFNPVYPDNMQYKPSSSVLKCRINIGIGDIIYTKALFDSIKHLHSKIFISPNISVLGQFRGQVNDEYYLDFCIRLMKELFDSPPYVITDDQTYPLFILQAETHSKRMFPVKPDLKRYLCKGSLPAGLIEDDYVVITTKVRGIWLNTYKELIKSGFWDKMIRLSSKYKIVILGERDIAKTKEYKIHKDFIYSIYNEIKKRVPANNVVDLTIPELGLTVPSIDKIKQDSLIMNKAAHVICLGIGGNQCIATAVANSSICLRDNDQSDFVNPYLFDDTRKYPDVFSTKSIPLFLNKLENIMTRPAKKEYKAKLYLGIGTLIYIKAMLDKVKRNYNAIYLSPYQYVLDEVHPKDPHWKKFTDDLLKLFFSEAPYVITDSQAYPKRDGYEVMNDGFEPVVPDLTDYLCKGALPPNLLDKQYIVLTTKVRWFYRSFYNKAKEAGLWQAMAELSKKYPFVILGERVVEENPENIKYKEHLYSIYDDIVKNIPNENLIDMSMPAWGKTPPSLEHLQQDCLIMNKAVYALTLGIGGNFCLSTAVANTIGLADPADPDPLSQKLYDGKNFFPRTWIVRDYMQFIERLKVL